MADGPLPPFAATDSIPHSRRIEGMNARALLVMSTAVVIVAVLPAATAAAMACQGRAW